jgi:hypothetical protein
MIRDGMEEQLDIELFQNSTYSSRFTREFSSGLEEKIVGIVGY